MEQLKKKKSRDAARQRRGQQNGEFGELASQLPLPAQTTEKLDRLCAMRLSNSYIKIKHLIHQLKAASPLLEEDVNEFSRCLPHALDGFVFVLAEDGQCMYISPNIKQSLGLKQLDLMGDSFYKYVQACDHNTLAEQLNGQVPLEDMEIFDGLFCSEAVGCIKNPKRKVSESSSPHRSFFLRVKSTLTSRGKSVNINASTYRVVHCTGTMKMYRTKYGLGDGYMTRCLLAVGNPLLSPSSIEMPIDRHTFLTKHSLDFKIFEVDCIMVNVLGYASEDVIGQSWYKHVHVCDSDVLKTCHDTLLLKGQAVSSYYRLLRSDGGWIWVQSKANLVYLETTGKPHYILCVHSVISGVEAEGTVLSQEQLKICSSKRKLVENSVDELLLLKKCREDSVIQATPNTELDFPPPPDPEPGQEATSDMPELEFLDFEDVGVDTLPGDVVFGRSPFMPNPMADVDFADMPEAPTAGSPHATTAADAFYEPFSLSIDGKTAARANQLMDQLCEIKS